MKTGPRLKNNFCQPIRPNLLAKCFRCFYGKEEKHENVCNAFRSTGSFISPSGISELDCATTKTDTAEMSIPIGRETLQVFFVLGALAYFQFPPIGGNRDEEWRSQ